jgi:hypothetical protein
VPLISPSSSRENPTTYLLYALMRLSRAFKAPFLQRFHETSPRGSAAPAVASHH